MKSNVIYILEYPISNWAFDEINEMKKLICHFRYTTVGDFYKMNLDSHYFRPVLRDYIRSFIRIILNLHHYFPIVIKYKKYVGITVVYHAFLIDEKIRPLKNVKIHCHFASSSTTVALILYQISGYPYSFTVHAWDIFFNTVDKSLLRKKMIFSYYIRAISHYNKGYLQKVLPSNEPKIRVIHCGIIVENFPFIEKSINKEKPIVLSASNLVEKKGYQDFIRSIQDFEIEGFHFNWKIAGKGPFEKTLKDLIIKKNLEGKIELLEPIPHDELVRFFKMGDFFFLPCKIASNGDRDGIPVILMEAMASGLITISTSVSGIPELIKNNENGFLLKKNTFSELIHTIKYINDLPDRTINKIRINARLTVENYFNIRKIAKEHLRNILAFKQNIRL